MRRDRRHPGNHDSRNVGYVHFEELFGDRNSVLRKGEVTIVAVDSTEPDLDNGQIGRGRYRWIEEQFAGPADLRVFVLHHHLLPVPGTGRERNIVNDAGDTLEALQRAGVDLVLAGHKHVPYAWRLENLFVVNAGTVSSSRLRGKGRPCYNVVEVEGIPRTSRRRSPPPSRRPGSRYRRAPAAPWIVERWEQGIGPQHRLVAEIGQPLDAHARLLRQQRDEVERGLFPDIHFATLQRAAAVALSGMMRHSTRSTLASRPPASPSPGSARGT